MSIKFRLILFYTVILVVVIAVFGTAVYLIAEATLLDDVDRGLDEIAMQLREQTEAFVMGNQAVLSLPSEELDVFQASTAFFVILDPDGRVLARSANLGRFNDVLDPNGPHAGRYYGTVTQNGVPLRVLTEPLYIEVAGQRQLIGHLQVARLVDNQVAVMEQLQLIMLFTGLAAASLSLLVGAWLSHRLLKPLDDITAVAMRITRADDLSRRLPDTGRDDEIGRLTLVLNQTLERLETLFHSRQRFLADVSHELRTPLTTIRGNLDLMRRMGEADPETLDVLQEEVQRMTRLVDDLLLLARADTGGLPIRREAVELDNVFLDVVRQIQSVEQPVKIVLEEVDQVCVLGDVDRLKQLVLNLVDNAIKYTPAGGEVTLSLGKKDGAVRLAVSDSGVGIPAEDLPRIFDRFYRVDKARSRRMGGSGLGLSIARWIAQAHGGEIRVDSKLGEGSTFTLTLPALDGAPSGAPNGRQRERVPAGQPAEAKG
ncbi:MAG: ATP-binding protein [Candidatus Promineifilaceae bacterium]